MTYQDRAGQPISRERWKFLQDDLAYVKVAVTHVGPPGNVAEFLVSTVWTGFAHGPGSPPLFETVGYHRSTHEATQCVTPTEEEASECHTALVEFLAEKVKGADGAATITHLPQRVSLIKA